VTEVLIVDDDAVYGELIGLAAVAHSRLAVVHRVSSVAEALRFLDSVRASRFPALVLTNVNLESDRGRELIGFLRHLQHPLRAAVVVLTSLHGRQYMDDCYALGADGCFIKPAHAQELAGLMHHIWRHILKRDPQTGHPLPDTIRLTRLRPPHTG